MAELLTKTVLAMAKERGMDQKAFRTAMNISAGRMTNWKRRKSIPADEYAHVAEVLNCSLDELLGLEPPEPPAGWPFPGVHPARFYSLSSGEQMRLQGYFVDELAKIEQERRMKAPPKRQSRPRVVSG